MADLVRAIPVSNVAHPLVDRVGESNGRRWSLTESRAPVVVLDGWHLDLLRRCTARGRELILATDETSALTPAFVHVWRQAGAHWLVRDPSGGLRDGFSGHPLRDVGDLWSDRAAESGSDTRDVAVRHLRPQPSDALELTALVSVRMPARGSSLLGGAVTELAAAVGDVPDAWGPCEPVSRAWDVDALTGAVRKRMPKPVPVLVRGARTAAVLQVRRTRSGVEESTYATLSVTGADADLGAEAASHAGDALARLAGAAMPLAGLVLAGRGRRDLLRAPYLRTPPAPVALLVGPPVAKELGLSPDGERQRVGAEPVGRAKLPALLYRLSIDPDDIAGAWAALDTVFAGFDPATRAAALGATQATLTSARPASAGPTPT